MTDERTRPPNIADERTQVLGWLDLQRALVPWKCEGLDDAAGRLAPIPSSPLMSLAGLVSHLRWTEHCWFDVIFAGGPHEVNPQFRDPDDGDWDTGETPLAQLVAAYEAQCAASNAIVAAHSLDDVATHPDFGGMTLRWILLHMLEETGRHAGHADVVRELADGTKGYW